VGAHRGYDFFKAKFSFADATHPTATQLNFTPKSNWGQSGYFQLAFILPAHNQLIVDRPNPFDRPQGFLRHLLFEEAFHPSLEDDMPIVRP